MEADSTSNSNCPGCIAAAVRSAELEALVVVLEGRNRQLQTRNGKLEALLAASTRSSKRQSAPFSRGPAKADPKTPGRKAGDDYGTIARRAVPAVIDETHEAPVADAACPRCGGTLGADGVEQQYQTEIPRRPICRQFNIHFARCSCCDKRVQGRHPLQTSNAIGCCASQLGPDAQAAIVHLNKSAGLSHGKTALLFTQLFGIPVTRGGVCQAMLRAARRCRGQYDQILRDLGQAKWLVPDETGWRVGGDPAWLHACVSPDAVGYLIDRRRGFEGSSQLIPPDYAGVMVHDGYKPYQRFYKAIHQTCLAHLLRRCREMLEVATRGAVIFPRQIKAILQEALKTRDAAAQGRITPASATRKARTLRGQIRRLTGPNRINADNDRLARHLYENQNRLFKFLEIPGIDATNYRAEQAIRPAVVNRKVWGGSRTQAGATAQSILMSILATAGKRGIKAIDHIAQSLKSALATLPPPPPQPQTG